MKKFTSSKNVFALLLMGFASFILGCSQQSAAPLSGIWRSEEAVAGKNLVIEFAPGGTGRLFSGSIIGFPTDTAFEWQRDGDRVQIKTVANEAIEQTMTILSHDEKSLLILVNQTELALVRVDGRSDANAANLLP